MEALQRGFETVLEQFALWGPRVLLGLVLLVVGWVVAKVLQRWVSALAVKTGLDKPFSQMAQDAELPTLPETTLPSRLLGVVVFWVVILSVLVGFLSAMKLDTMAQPITNMLNRVGSWMPNLAGALLLALVGWLLAVVAKSLVVRLLTSVKFDERLATAGVESPEAAEARRFTSTLGVVAYALVLLLFIPTALDTLGLHFVADTVQRTVNAIADALPGILAAAGVLGVAALIAYLVRPPLTRLLAGTGIDAWGRQIGLAPGKEGKETTISTILGHAAFWAILFFAFPAALDRLGLDPIVTPMQHAWEVSVATLPNLFAALGIGLGAYILGRIVGPIVESLLRTLGVDTLLGKMGLARFQSIAGEDERRLPSRIGAALVVFLIYLLLAQEALHALGMTYMADLVRQIFEYLPSLFVGVAIFALALYLGGVVASMVRNATGSLSDVNSDLAAMAANVAVVVFGVAMALAQLRIGGELVQNAVLLIIGALCLALAIAVGLGAKPTVERWIDRRFQ